MIETKPERLVIALAQFNPTVGDVDGNIDGAQVGSGVGLGVLGRRWQPNKPKFRIMASLTHQNDTR